MSPLVISAKELGAFAMEGACQRCLWITLHVKPLPYQTFPGIFSSIDAYTKRIIQGYFEREGALPDWLAELGDVEQSLSPPSYQRFSVQDPATGATLRGTADAIFLMGDGSYTIVDYKTARYTPGQEALLLLYQAQLNGYAYIANRVDMGPVSQVALIYMEPVTDAETAASPDMVSGRGFSLALSATIVPVDLDPDGMIPRLLSRAQKTSDLPGPPEPGPDCKNCQAVLALAAVVQ